MKSRLKFLIPALLLPNLLFSQVTKERDVVGSAGDYSTTPTLELSWTVGEVAVTTQQTANLVVTEGFQQANFGATEIAEDVFPAEIIVYPNPVSDVLNFEVNSKEGLRLTGELYDLSGKKVADIPVFQVDSEYRGTFDCSDLAAGKWLLRFSDSSFKVAKTFTFIKLK
jgi:hypothetical protein